MSDTAIQAWVLDDGSKNAVERGLRLVDVDPPLVRDALTRMSELLPADPEPDDGRLRPWRMDEVTLSLEISAEAGLRLVASGTVGVTSAVSVTFRRL